MREEKENNKKKIIIIIIILLLIALFAGGAFLLLHNSSSEMPAPNPTVNEEKKPNEEKPGTEIETPGTSEEEEGNNNSEENNGNNGNENGNTTGNGNTNNGTTGNSQKPSSGNNSNNSGNNGNNNGNSNSNNNTGTTKPEEKVIEVESITVDKKKVTLELDASETIIATVKPDDATNKTVTWSSDNTKVAVVNNGKITGINVGTAIITATAGTKSVTIEVTVEPNGEACTIGDEVYYDKDGRIANRDTYINSCKPVAKTAMTDHCSIVEDKFYDSEGYEVLEADYNKSCKKPAPSKPVLDTYKEDGDYILATYKITSEYQEAECYYGTDSANLTNKGVINVNNGKFTCQANNLEEYTTYYFITKVRNGETIVSSDIEQMSTTDKAIMPATPVIGDTYASDSSITVNFTKALNAKGYRCYTADKEGVITTLPSGDLQCNINGLEEGTSYRVTIEAINKDLKSSTYTDITTDYSVPDAPRYISSTVEENQITANFSTVDKSTAYVCLYKETSNTGEFLSSAATVIDNTVLCTFSDLKENTNYDVKVKVVNGTKENESTVTKITTDYKTPDKPTVTEIAKTRNTVTIKTNKPAYATNLICEYGVSNSNITRQGTVRETENGYSCEITNLTENTTYYVRLTSDNNGRKTNALEVFSVMTNDFETPGTPIMSNSSSTTDSITATFGVTENTTSYKGYYGTDRNVLQEVTVQVTDNGVILNISDLQPSTTYYVKLVSINGTKETSSQTYEIRTDDIVPSKPTYIQDYVTDSSFEVEFNVSDVATEYMCYYGTNENDVSFYIDAQVSGNKVICGKTRLTQNTNYYVQVIAFNNSRFTESDIVTVKTDYATPEKPTLVSSIWNSDTNIVLTYTKPTYATTYTCYYGLNENNMTSSVAGIVNGNNITCNITGLQEDQEYYAKLVVTNESIKENESDVLNFSTEVVPPETPRVISSGSTYSSITVDYDLLSDDDGSYTYVCSYGKDSNNLEYTKAAVKTEYSIQCNITNLDENTNYYVKLTASYKGKSTDSDITTVKTQYKTPMIPVVDETSSTDKSITAIYSNIDSNYSYECRYGTDSNNLSNSVNPSISGNKLTCTVDGLVENKTYYIRVIATNGTEVTPSAITPIKTQYTTPEKPTLASSESTSDSITAIFNVGKGATDYICYYGVDEVNLLGKPTVLANNQVRCEFNSLESDTTYQFKLVASNNNAVSTESDIQSEKTLIAAPSIPVIKETTNIGNAATVVYEVSGTIDNMVCKYGTSANSLTSTATAIKDVAGNVICNATGLNPNSDYYFQLTVSNSTSSVSSVVDKVSTGPIKPGKPTYMSGVISKTTITARFTPVENANDYMCYFGTSADNLDKVTYPSIMADKILCDYSGLTEGTTYYVQLEAKYGSQSTFSDVYPLTTQTTTVVAADLLEEVHNQDVIVTKWKLNGYSTAHTCTAGLTEQDQTIEGHWAIYGDELSCSFAGLNPNTTYYVQVNTINLEKQAPKTITIKTDKKAQPGVCMEGFDSIDNLSTTKNPLDAIMAVRVNSACSVSPESEEARKALEVLQKALTVEIMYAMDEFDGVNGIAADEAAFGFMYTVNGNVAGYYARVRLYGVTGETIGQYYLKEDWTRHWIIPVE